VAKITVDSIPDLSMGSVFLATGGGGDPYVPGLITQQALETIGPAELISPDDLADDAYVVTIGGVGAPTVSLELLPSLAEVRNTINGFQDRTGKKIDAIASFEIGGGNSLIPITASAVTGRPVIDGDGMARALPEAQMMSYPICGVHPTPAVGCDYMGNISEFHVDSIMEYEEVIRQYAVDSGGMVTVAEHPMTGKQLKESVLPHTLTFATKLGEVLRVNRGNAHDMLQHLEPLFNDSIYGGIYHLYTGKVVDVSTKIIGGYDVGEATLTSFSGDGEPLKLTIKNEFLLAYLGDRLLASVPDLITLVDYETSTPLNAERLRYGQRVTVFGIKSPEFYRTNRALQFVAPSCFGFPIEYVPIEQLLNI